MELVCRSIIVFTYTYMCISGISFDRVCGVRFTMDDGDGSVMSITGVYLPCLDQDKDCY